MDGRKRKFEINEKEVSVYREKLRRPGGSPLKLTNRERKKFTFKSPYPQKFSIPSNVIYYIAKNPEFPKGHLKFISTCKSVLQMSRITPLEMLWHYEDKSNMKKLMAHRENINLRNRFLKLWIYDQFSIWNESLTNIASSFIKQIYEFSLRELTLFNQVLTFEELQFLVSGSSLEKVGFYENVVRNADESVTEFENFFELLCCKDLEIAFHSEQNGIGRNTTSKIIKILSEQMPPEQDIKLWEVPEKFDFVSFSVFLKANMTAQQHTIEIDFSDEISDAYKNQLQQFVDELVQMRGIEAHTVPIIHFPDQDEEAHKKLWEMRDEPVEGILRRAN